jgi:hypothetical protein
MFNIEIQLVGFLNMNNICIDCKGETITEKGVIYVRRGKENVEICLSCWQKTRE